MSDVRWSLRRALRDKDLYDVRRRVRIDLDEIAHPADLAAMRAEFRDWGSSWDDYGGLGVTFKPRSVLEIGVRLGYSGYCLCSGSLLAGVRRVTYTGIDAERDEGPPLWGYRTLAMAAETFRRYLPEVRTMFHCCDTVSDGLPETVTAQTYRLIHVDGAGSYRGTLADLRSCWPVLAVGGVMVASQARLLDRQLAVGDFMTWLVEESDAAFSCQYVHNEIGMALFRKDEK